MLRRIRVQHFKSLADVSLDFETVTLLVGPNGAGKSNIVDAIRFVRDAVAQSLDHAVNDRGGIDVIRQFSRTRPYLISFELEFSYDEFSTSLSTPEREGYPENQIGSYSFKLDSKRGEYLVVEEKAEWTTDELIFDDNNNLSRTRTRISRFDRDKNGDIFLNGKKEKSRVASDQLAIRFFTGPFQIGFSVGSEVLSQLSFASVYPNTLKAPARPDTEKKLREDCSNWASIIRAMRQRENGKRAIHMVTEYMREVLPGLQEVKVKNAGGYLIPQFLVKDRDQASGHFFDPIQLSDGTLRLFGILLALYQHPIPDFLGIEEPEQTVHPGLLQLLDDAFKEASTRTQILITTHSPYLLEYFDPKEVRVVSTSMGETKVSNIRKAQLLSVERKLMSLGELMTLDGLQPEANK